MIKPNAEGWVQISYYGIPLEVKCKYWSGTDQMWDDPGDAPEITIDEIKVASLDIKVEDGLIEVLMESPNWYDLLCHAMWMRYLSDSRADEADHLWEQIKDEELLAQAEKEDL
jgi:hypothetical protein